MSDTTSTSDKNGFLKNWLGPVLFLIPLIYYYFFYPANYPVDCITAFDWMSKHVWNSNPELGHCWFIPLICVYMLWHKRKDIAKAVKSPSLHGLWLLIPGLFLVILAARTHQGRIPMIALPFLLSGTAWYFWGRKVAIMTAYPIFFFLFCIPIPGGIMAVTLPLQLIATHAAHYGAGLFGVQTIIEGTNIISADGNWDAYNIAGGCSGLHSLMSLMMISFAWAYLADKLALWKRIILAISAIPLAIIGNAFRVTSIFIFAEYISTDFAGKTWHDWSGLLLFFPISLLGLTLLHGILAGQLPFFNKKKTIIISNTKDEA